MRYLVIGLLLAVLAGCKPPKEQPEAPEKDPDKRIVKEYYSDGSDEAEFFRGKLTDNMYWNIQLESIETRDEQGTLVYYVPQGSFIMETVNIVARIRTSKDNFCILQKKYDLAAENKLSL